MTETERRLRMQMSARADSMCVKSSYAQMEKAICQRSRRRVARVLISATMAAVAVVGIGIIVGVGGSRKDSVRVVGADSGSGPRVSAELNRHSSIHINVESEDHLGGPSNLIVGTLRLDDKLRCLYLVVGSGERFNVVFPYGSTITADGARVLDRSGDVFAEVNRPVDFGGSIADSESVIPSPLTCGAAKSIHVWKG